MMMQDPTRIVIGRLMPACLCAVVAVTTTTQTTYAQWTQWGGPEQNFIADSSGIAPEWSAEGPRKIWTRDLGDGYSSILVDGGRLYTMYRGDDKEIVIALNAKTGETIWERAYDAAPAEGHVEQFGKGPRATPMISGNRLFAIGVSGVMHCLDKNTGKVHWSHDLWKEFGGNFLNHGYSSSPIAYKDNVIALIGGDDASIVAFNMKSGDIVWKNNDGFKNSYSTPAIRKVAGETQLVTFMATEVVALNPDTGKLRWSFPHTNQWQQNVCMPTIVDDHVLISCPETGTRGLKITREGDEFQAEEIWKTKKLQFYHVTAIREGDFMYASHGPRAPNFMAAVNVKTGKIAWRKRGLAKANCIKADGKLIILDEDGTLALATANPEEFTIHSQVKLFDDVSWTVPTIVGKTMYARDKHKIVALDLS